MSLWSHVEVALLLDQLFMSRVTGLNVNVSINVSTFPRFYQQPSRESRLVSDSECEVMWKGCMLLSLLTPRLEVPPLSSSVPLLSR